MKNHSVLPYIIITAIGIGVGLYHIHYQNNYLVASGGEIVYVSIGKSIFTGKGYRDDFSQEKNLHTQYPPLIPLINGMVAKITKYSNLSYFYILYFLFYLASILLTSLFLKTFSNFSKLMIFLLILLFIGNGIVFSNFPAIGTESFFYVCSILSLINLYKFIQSKNSAYFVWSIILAAIAAYSRASGLSLCITISIVIFIYFGISWYTLLSLLSFVPILSFFYYQWLFFGVTNYYLKTENFFSHWNTQYLKFNIGELIFYIPSESVFYLYGDKDREWLLSKLHIPILWLTKGVRLDLMGILSILFWSGVLIQFIRRLRNKDYLLPIYLGVFILMFIFHCCEFACADPRLFFQVLPVMILFFVEFITSISNKYIKISLLSLFILFYFTFNIYGIIQYTKDMKKYSKSNFAVGRIDACLVDKKVNETNIWKARNHLFKLCFNKGYDTLDIEKETQKLQTLSDKNVVIYTDYIDKYIQSKYIHLIHKLQLKNNDYLLYVKVEEPK